MMSGDGKVVDLHSVVRQAPDGGGGLGQGNFLQDGLFKLQIEFRQGGPPENSLLKIVLYHGRSTILSSRQVMLSSPPRSLAARMSAPQACSRVEDAVAIFRIS